MKKPKWKLIAGVVMLLLSISFYFLHYFIFRDSHHIFIYLIGDIAFVFIEVLLVTLIIHHVLQQWEKQSHLKKLNMVIETFFSEFGKHVIVYFSNFDKNIHKLHDYIIPKDRGEDGCGDINLNNAFKASKKYKPNIDMTNLDINKLNVFLKSKRGFLVNLLQNPNLLEHEAFTETLMAIFHITEELNARDLTKLSEEDIEHTKIDFERAYKYLILQWINYMKHTKIHFPYFFLFAMRTNPFDEEAAWIDNYISDV